MRRLDRNYIVGDHYLHVQEEIHNMHIKLEKIITMIHEFWKEVQEFDGSG